jgi:hypothetical protein
MAPKVFGGMGFHDLGWDRASENADTRVLAHRVRSPQMDSACDPPPYCPLLTLDTSSVLTMSPIDALSF